MRKIYAQLLFLILPFSLFSQIQLGPNLEGDTYEDLFGNTVAISGDGNRIIASGPGNSVAAHRAGMAKVMEWDGNNWNQLGSNFLGILSQDQMNGVAISGNGNTVAVSASFGGQNEEGYFRAYNWDGTNWNLQGGIVYGDTLIEGLGSKIELSEDGTRLVVAALSYRQSRGRVKVFEWNGSNWTAIGNSIVGSRSHQLLGYDVAISGDGQRIAVGLPSFQLGGGMGRVDLYQWDSGSWLPMGNGIAFDGIGTSIDLSHDGSSVIVGDPRNQGNGGIEGAAKVYQWDGTSWLPRGTTIVGDSPFDLFGYDVAINGDGDRIAVSAINHDLNSQALAFETGQVKVYDWSGLDWIHIGQDIEGESFNDSLGFSLGLSKSGTRMVAGAPSHDHFNINQARGMTKVFYVGNFVQHGTVRLDENNNCIADSTENTQAGVSISVEGNNFQWTTNTDFWGRYAVLLDTGLFKIKVNPSGYPYSFPCPDSQLISIDSSTTNLADIDFVLQDSISCPYLTVEIASPFIRRCFPGFYNLEYCNLGSQDAPGAYVDVELDSNLTFISSNGTLLSQNGQWLRFDLDTLKAGECGRIRVSFEENCQAVPDQMVCSRANIYPDSLCTASIPNVEIEKSCRPDSVVFEIKNLANAFGAPQAYFILNQAGIVDSGSIQLGMSDSTFIAVNDTGTSQAYQFVLSPNDPTHYHNPGWFTCDTHALITSMLFPTETVQAFSDVDCQSNIGSYDPNDKTAIPPAGDILPASPLTYTIRFQNTGTDTAFFINILDTLSQNLDINTLEVQVASHPYVFEVISQNPAVVRFRFDPIFLPDSTTDLEGSNGFVKFGIQMMPGLPLGSTIENKAAIYFDFNAPIITNTVVHTLVEPTVCKNDMTTDSITACEPILWIDGQLYDSSTSVPMFTLQDASGCDSVVNLNFTLAEIDPSVDLVDVTLMALEENAAYQWVDCDDNFKHIAGATSRSYTPPIPDGYFGVIISKNACQDTSECTRLVFILAELLLENDLKIFPNPTDGKFSIELEAAQSIKRIQLYDLYGKKVLDQLVNEKKQVSLVLDIGRGIYLLEVETSNGQRINTKMVKK